MYNFIEYFQEQSARRHNPGPVLLLEQLLRRLRNLRFMSLQPGPVCTKIGWCYSDPYLDALSIMDSWVVMFIPIVLLVVVLLLRSDAFLTFHFSLSSQSVATCELLSCVVVLVIVYISAGIGKWYSAIILRNVIILLNKY